MQQKGSLLADLLRCWRCGCVVDMDDDDCDFDDAKIDDNGDFSTTVVDRLLQA